MFVGARNFIISLLGSPLPQTPPTVLINLHPPLPSVPCLLFQPVLWSSHPVSPRAVEAFFKDGEDALVINHVFFFLSNKPKIGNRIATGESMENGKPTAGTWPRMENTSCSGT